MLSTDSDSQVWYTLREFETRDVTSRRYQIRHSLDLSASKAKEISFNVIQAREYFRNAAAATFVVRPLLQYYGVSALSRALVLFLSPSMREASIRPTHGLSAYKWRNVLSDGPQAIGTLSVRLTKGIFMDFLKATDNRFYFRANSSAVNWSIGGDIPEVDASFTFEEVVARIPEVAAQYRAWTGRESQFMLMQAFKIHADTSQYEFTINPLKNQLSVDDVFPMARCPNRTVSAKNTDLIVRYDQPFLPYFSQKSEDVFGIGDIALYRPLDSGLYATPIAVCSMASYTLGMLCRYFPSVWMALASSERGDAAYPLVTRLIDWIQTTLPAMVVDLFQGPYDFERE